MHSENEIEALVLAKAKQAHFTEFHRFFLEHPTEIAALVSLALSFKKHPVPAYSAWLLVHISKAKPALLLPFQKQFEQALLTTTNHSIQRSLLALLLELPFCDEAHEGPLLDVLFEIFKTYEFKVVNRVLALYLLKRFVQKYPELDPEIRAQIELIQANGLQPAMKVAIRNYLN
ncbi:MAG: hypothetical protein RLZZ301_714 [Bacteroidota bacterium]|jgi:hypothetical protein